PLVSAWSIDLMGQLSSKYAGRHGVPHASSLNELLQLWMSCGATRTLMEIYAQCLSAMISSCPDACVDALLDTSGQHSPHFDWVVAHIGGTFPGTIISRVLSCGLKDFCVHGNSSSFSSSSCAVPPDSLFPGCPDKRVPKIGSVVGILGHLVARHSASIKQELLRMFHESLCPVQAGDGAQASATQKATVPFLLQLAAMSPTLLGTVSPELIDSLTPLVLNQLRQHFTGTPREEAENLVSLIVHLICQTGSGAHRILQFLVNTAMPASVIMAPSPGREPVHESAREACDRIVQLLLLNLQKLVHNRSPGYGPTGLSGPMCHGEPCGRPVPFLDGLRPHVDDMCSEALRLERKRHVWLHQLLALLAVYHGASCATDCLCHMLSQARSQEELGLAVQLHNALAPSMRGLLPATVGKCLARVHSASMSDRQIARLLGNLALVVQWERGRAEVEGRGEGGGRRGERGEEVGPCQSGSGLAQAVTAHLRDLSRLLLHPDPEVCESACLLLSVSPVPRSAGPAELSGAVRAAAGLFFLLLHRRRRESALGHCLNLLTGLGSVSPAALKAVLQHLVRAALHGANRGLFGGGEAENSSPGMDPGLLGPADTHSSLLDVNLKFGTAVNFAGSIWAVFHAGVIGRGLKAAHKGTGLESEAGDEAYNVYRLINLAVRCSSNVRVQGENRGESPGLESDQPQPIDPEAAKMVAVVLVETLCPDVTNSELSWPPEEHSKNTVERDIQIRKRFEENPLLFDLLHLVALGRPALCYCSVLLRGLLATLMAHWEASRDSVTSASPWHLRASCQLIACMGQGQLLPPALSNMHEIFHKLTPFEVHLLLLSVWEYLRDKGPMPQKFTFSPERGQFYRDFSRDGDISKYLQVLHSVLHKNIATLGYLCGRFQV
uniref:Integrator complex subunit 5 n=1 Tax=Callorhinchus milii TaxID=7868 RepID=A0A4W3GK81_CALMI